MDVSTFGDVRFSGTAKNLLNRLRSGSLPLAEFLAECAYWAVKDGFQELIHHQPPTKPTTQAFSEYDSLPPMKKAKVEAQFFANNPEIQQYQQQFLMIKNINDHNKEWLTDMLSRIPEDDFPTRAKIKGRLGEFASDEVPEEAQKLVEMFDGKVL